MARKNLGNVAEVDENDAIGNASITGGVVGLVLGAGGGFLLGEGMHYIAEQANDYLNLIEQIPTAVRYTIDIVLGVAGARFGFKGGLTFGGLSKYLSFGK